MSRLRLLAVIGLAVAVAWMTPVIGLNQPEGAPSEFKIAVVSFLSGSAAAPFGVPARNGVEVLVDKLNSGSVPAPHDTAGIGGVPISMRAFDEAGGAEAQVEQFRGLAGDFDVVIGYISSGDCEALAPIAEETDQLTVFSDCGTNTIFEEVNTDPKFLFRTHGHQVLDSVGAVRYALATQPDLSTIAGINQNYSWGQSNWRTFKSTMGQLEPQAEVVSEQFPELFKGEYSAEISALLRADPDVIYSSFWGGDMEAFVIQAKPRGLFDTSTVMINSAETALPRLGADIPRGVVISARGPHGPFAPDNELNRWYVNVYKQRFAVRPVYGAYHYAQAVLGVKAAYEKAIAANNGQWPSMDQVIQAFENLTFETPSGTISLALSQGHQAIEPMVWGTTGDVSPETGERELVQVLEFPAECVNPPAGMTTPEWIAAGLPTPEGVDCSGTPR